MRMETKMNTDTNTSFDSKDALRIESLLTRAKGFDGKAIQLATVMARAITNADKALRRGRAAEEVNQHDLAKIFFDRHRELAGPNTATGHAPTPEMEIEIKGISFRQKEKLTAKPRIYFWDTGAGNLGEMFMQRYTPKQVFTPHLDDVLMPLGMRVSDGPLAPGQRGVKVRWSQFAGCSCPCSPGFVVDNSSYGYDIHVDYLVVVKTQKATA